VKGHPKTGGRRKGSKASKHADEVVKGASMQAPPPNASQQRIAAQADMARLAVLASTLDAMIDKGSPTVPMLRLRMDLARTLSVLRDRLRRLPEPEPAAEDWLATLQEQPEPEPVPDAIAF